MDTLLRELSDPPQITLSVLERPRTRDRTMSRNHVGPTDYP